MKRLILWGATISLMFAGVASAANLNAAGATFPQVIYQKWFEEFKAKTGNQINYQPNGSSAGVKALTDGTVDFSASDVPMTDAQLGAVKIKTLHFPTVLGAVVLTYNVPGMTSDLKLSGSTVGDIFLGDVKKWNDPKIAADNPGVKLPNTDIMVIHRADGSGTSGIFTDYLAKVNANWKSKVGAGNSVAWPTGLGSQGNAGVAGSVKQTPGSIGYVELAYAIQNNMAVVSLKNANGKFVKPNLESVTAAAAGMKDMPEDFRIAIANGPGDKTYPISSFTWMLIPSQIPDAAKKKAVVDFLTWMLADGQKDAAGLQYAPLPASVVAKEKKQIALIK